MSDFTVVTVGPWRIRTSVVLDGRAEVRYCIGGQSEVIASETHADLALLRDAITEYLTRAETEPTGCSRKPAS